MPRHPRPRRSRPDAPIPPVAEGVVAPPPDADPPAAPPDDGEGLRPAAPSLAELGIAGVSRRRIAILGLAALAAWVIVAFAGQASGAARAMADVDAARARNEAAVATKEALERELALVTQERWILQQARAYGLWSRQERTVALAPGAPSLPPDAPGSPARRLGAEAVESSPLEGWLEVLFGPAPGG